MGDDTLTLIPISVAAAKPSLALFSTHGEVYFIYVLPPLEKVLRLFASTTLRALLLSSRHCKVNLNVFMLSRKIQ